MKQNTEQRRLTPAAFAAASRGDMKNFLAAATPGGIEAQEKAGQLEQAAKQTLPIDLRNREQWEKLGFVFGEKIDDLFQSVIFPDGWKKVPTVHSMWSDIVDGQGRKRGAIFYKAAFYDQRAHAHLERRFGVSTNYEGDRYVFISDACGQVSKKIGGFGSEPDSRENRSGWMAWHDKIEEARKELTAWLTANYPDHGSPLAYWEDAK
jgi:hypothetical protein